MALHDFLNSERFRVPTVANYGDVLENASNRAIVALFVL